MAAPVITDSVIKMGTGAASTDTTGALTIASGDVLYVGVIIAADVPPDVSSVTSSAGGGSLSSIADSGTVQTYMRLHIWRSTSPTAGTPTITVNFAASADQYGIVAVSVSGVDSGTPNGTPAFTNGNGVVVDAVSASISSSTDAIVLDFIGRLQSSAMSITGGQTELEQGNQGSIHQVGSSWEAGATTVTTAWGFNAAGTVSAWEWVLGALSINGGSGGGGGLFVNPLSGRGGAAAQPLAA